MNTAKTTPINFNGSTSEYFGIWIVNVLLSLLTLGIYSAWAKVRKKKYFYNNTLIDNIGFDYHANPIAILKGRAIAFGFFIAYAFSQHLHPFLPLVFMILFFIALPWLVVRASIFNARNTSHRGLRFNFIGKINEAVWTFFVMPIVSMLTLGLGVPFSSHQKSKFLVGKHTFGNTPFNMTATVKQFYKEYMLCSAGILATLLCLLVPLFILSKEFFPHVNIPLPSMPHASEKDQFAALIGIAVAFIYLLLFLIFSSYLQARIGNLVWNSTTLNELSFKSSLRVRDLLWIYISNLLAIAFTFGLATPWAQIRTAKYRASKLQLVGNIDFEQFVGNKKADLKAMGEEMADMFDVDLSFG